MLFETGLYAKLPADIPQTTALANLDVAGGWQDGLGVFVQHHKGGRLRVLAVSGEARAPQLPEVPTFKDLGMPSLSFGSAYALYVPAGTPAGKIDDWSRAMRKVLAMAMAAIKQHQAALARFRLWADERQ